MHITRYYYRVHQKVALRNFANFPKTTYSYYTKYCNTNHAINIHNCAKFCFSIQKTDEIMLFQTLQLNIFNDIKNCLD